MGDERGKSAVQIFGLLRGEFAPFGGQPGSFPYRRLVARQRGKWREQRGTVEHHIRSYRVLRIVLKRVNEVSVVQKN